MLDSSPDIESDNIIKHYQRQPKQLEKLCLANFVACYNCVKDERADWSRSGSSVTGLYDFLPETSFDDNPDDDPISINVTECQCEPREYKLKIGVKLVKQKKPKIIQSVRYSKGKDPENRFSRTAYALNTMVT